MTIKQIQRRLRWMRRRYGKDTPVKISGDGDVMAMRFIHYKGKVQLGPQVELFGPFTENGWKAAHK